MAAYHKRAVLEATEIGWYVIFVASKPQIVACVVNVQLDTTNLNHCMNTVGSLSNVRLTSVELQKHMDAYFL